MTGASSETTEIQHGEFAIRHPRCECGSGTWNIEIVPIEQETNIAEQGTRLRVYRNSYEVWRTCLRNHRRQIDPAELTYRKAA